MTKSAIVAVHSFSPGTAQALYSYFKRHQYDAMLIEHKLFGSPLTWFTGAIDTFWQVLRQPYTYDLYVGSNRLNACVGIILKWVGKVKKVVYFSPDWVENRLTNKLLDNLYHSLDYFCVTHADITWNSSAYMDLDFMMQERLKRGYPKKLLKKQIQLPDGTDPYLVLSFNQINKKKIGYVGHLIESSGMEMVIDSFEEIQRQIPKVEMIVIGSGDIEQQLRKKAKGLNIKFTGFVGDMQQVYKLLEDCAIAVAPYKPGTMSKYTDPGKVKNYLSLGLPIVMTTVPFISKEIHDTECGIAIPYEKQAFIQAVTTLLSNEKLLAKYRKNTVTLRDKYSWDRIFEKALKQSSFLYET